MLAIIRQNGLSTRIALGGRPTITMETNIHRHFRLAAAIAHHLPGASITLTTNDTNRVVAPLGLRESDMHPYEFRELVIACEFNGPSELLDLLELPSDSTISIEVSSTPPLLSDHGGGLYEILRADGEMAYVFASTLGPDDVAEAMLCAQTARESGPISAHLFYDDELDVTMAFFPGNGDHSHKDRIRAATASVAVAEGLASLLAA